MPTLAWRNDSDGFAFSNSWTFDAAERAALTGAAQSLVPAAIGAVGAVFPALFFDPILLTGVTAALMAAAAYPAAGPLPGYGMCGGMAYASLDYWRARTLVPRGANSNDQPDRSKPTSAAIRNLIWARLLNSLTDGGVLQRTIEWSLILNQLPAPFGGGPGAILNRTKTEWDLLRGHIDRGEPWPIGLVYTSRDIWYQHQILAYGYEVTGTNTGKLHVYDSNSPRQYGDLSSSDVTLDFSGPSLKATSPSDGPGTLAGFFCSNYVAQTPAAGLARSYGEFLSWNGDPRIWMSADGARMPVSGTPELTALGASTTDVCATGTAFVAKVVRPRDGALFRERSDARVYLYQGGSPFWIPDPNWLARFGGWNATRVVPDHTINAFAGPPDEGTLLREWSDPKVYRMMGGTRRWVTTPVELQKWGGFPSVRLVPDNALGPIPIGKNLP